MTSWLITSISTPTNPLTAQNPLTFFDEELEGVAEKLQVVRNDHLPDIIIFYTKQDETTQNAAVYTYKKTVHSFEAITFSTQKSITGLDSITPTGNKFFCTSFLVSVGFFFNENFEVQNEETIIPRYQYLWHPDFPHLGLRYRCNRKDSVCKGDEKKSNEEGYKANWHTFRKIDYISKLPICITLTRTSLSVEDFREGFRGVFVRLATDYIMIKDKVLVIYSNDTKYLSLTIVDLFTETQAPAKFPKLLNIKEVKQFDYAFGNYYLLLVDSSLTTCLWTTTATPYHFVRSACYNTAVNTLMESKFFLDKRTDGLLYMNFPINQKEHWTLRSTNRGRSWHEMKFFNTDAWKYSQRVHFKFSLHDSLNIPDNSESIDIHYHPLTDGLQPFITFDGGYTWRAVPETASKVILLNYRSVIISIDRDTNYINYSLNHAKSWSRLKLFESKPKVFYVVKLSNDDQKVLIVASGSNPQKIRFKGIDFSNLINRDCENSEYKDWYLPKSGSGGFCYRNEKILMTIRNSEIRCLDKKTDHIKQKFPCTCSSDDFPCTFGYRPYSAICVPEALSGQIHEPKKCDAETSDQRHHPGYVKLAETTCTPDISYSDALKLSQMCVNDEWTNILILHTKYKMYMLRILTPVSDIGEKEPSPIELQENVNINTPIAFDFQRQLLYNYHDQHIRQFKFFGTSEARIYFHSDPITDMVFDSISRVLIFLTSKRQLKMLSFLTNFRHVIHEDVVWFKYSFPHRLISFVTSRKSICHWDFLEPPKCATQNLDIKQAFIDLKKTMTFVLTSQRVLKIKNSVTDFTAQSSLNINDVSNFAVYGDHILNRRSMRVVITSDIETRPREESEPATIP
ncbi:Vacuolar protein sorting/targeting protein 10 [Thelohanellus kitauei]|uniref:Vacuolar protein sorting/targeting protein 10 n=1 Tax=Thelohanellus kitauei TaxID=669202 RepID=A0A0C2JCB6_THEKT|nr:Vacuolar protein sorting/targeting protein 10 [Thelohanellus kitauei]